MDKKHSPTFTYPIIWINILLLLLTPLRSNFPTTTMAINTITTTMASLLNPKPICNIKQYPFLKCTSKSSLTSCSVSTKTEDLGYGKKVKRIEMGIIGAIAASSILLGFGLNADATRIEYYATVADPPCQLTYVPSGLAYCDLILGSGPKAPYNELINVHYTARFGDERVFDSSYKRGRPLTMRIGVGKVIRGLDQGIFGGGDVPPMQVGGKRKLRIPPELAYGPEPAGCFSGDCNIPANATLLYDINFVGIYSGNRKE